jgi:hypothetical protein
MMASKEVVGELLVIQEVVDRVKVSKWTLANWRRSGFGPPYVRLKGNDIRYSEEGLRKWIKELTVDSIGEERENGKKFPLGGYGIGGIHDKGES